jgi:dihydrofolate reductase
MLISLIVAVSKNGVIGKDNQLIWRLPADLKRFKNLTMGHPMIMGRKTYESIGKPLPGRTSIVVSRNPDFSAEGVMITRSLEAAMEQAKLTGTNEAFIIGGGTIYQQALHFADRVYLTEVHAKIDGDTFFTISNRADWLETQRERHPEDGHNQFSFDFVTLIRNTVD